MPAFMAPIVAQGLKPTRGFHGRLMERRPWSLSCGLPLLRENLEDRAFRQRYNEQVAVRAGLDVRHDTKIAADEQRFALGNLVLGQVVGHSVRQSWVVNAHGSAVSGDVEVEQV